MWRLLKSRFEWLLIVCIYLLLFVYIICHKSIQSPHWTLGIWPWKYFHWFTVRIQWKCPEIRILNRTSHRPVILPRVVCVTGGREYVCWESCFICKERNLSTLVVKWHHIVFQFLCPIFSRYKISISHKLHSQSQSISSNKHCGFE